MIQQMPLVNFKEMLARPGALAELRKCASVVDDVVTFDPRSPCYQTFSKTFFAWRKNPKKKEMDGPALWAVLHRRPYVGFKDPASEQRWIDNEFTPSITCVICLEHWLLLLKEFPPDFSSPDAYFEWTVKVHNKVNERLGKAQYSLFASKVRWNPQTVQMSPVKSDTVSLLRPRPVPTADERMTILQPVCVACPSYLGLVNGGTQVKCDRKRGCKTCGGKAGEPQPIDLRSGECPANLWQEPIDRWGTFERVVLINLKRRTDRLNEFNDRLGRSGWPYKEPEYFEGIDGKALPLPDRWSQGHGAYGCWLGHQAVFARAIQDGLDSLFIFEDDAVFATDFRTKVIDFMNRVPEWDCVMFGGQHMKPAITIKPGIVKCIDTQRMHGYGVRGRFMRDLYQRWASNPTHTDHTMAPFLAGYRTYAPTPFLIGQAAGQSDINGQKLALRWWQP